MKTYQVIILTLVLSLVIVISSILSTDLPLVYGLNSFFRLLAIIIAIILGIIIGKQDTLSHYEIIYSLEQLDHKATYQVTGLGTELPLITGFKIPLRNHVVAIKNLNTDKIFFCRIGTEIPHHNRFFRIILDDVGISQIDILPSE